MLARRLIACLDVRDGSVVKGIRFQGLADAGDPAALAARYSDEGLDEIVMLDVSATIEGRPTWRRTVEAIARRVSIPLTAGGGIRSAADARAVLEAGADKASINSAALADPTLITSLARVYGSQAVVVAIDAKRAGPVAPGLKTRPPGGAADEGRVFRPGDRPGDTPTWIVYSRSGTAAEPIDAVSWAREAERRGAGEILLTSIDRDGTRAGFDCALTAAVSGAVGIPVIASGGAGAPEHFVEVFTTGRADAALAASILHFAEHGVRDLKAGLAAHGIPVRLDW